MLFQELELLHRAMSWCVHSPNKTKRDSRGLCQWEKIHHQGSNIRVISGGNTAKPKGSAFRQEFEVEFFGSFEGRTHKSVNPFARAELARRGYGLEKLQSWLLGSWSWDWSGFFFVSVSYFSLFLGSCVCQRRQGMMGKGMAENGTGRLAT